MKKLFTLFTKTLLVAVCLLGGASSAWAADAISCSAYLSATAGTPTVTDCTFKFFGQDGQAAGTVPAGTKITVSGVDYYYAKMNDNKNYYEVKLNKTVGGNDYSKFEADDVITVYLYTNGSTVSYKVGKTAQTEVSLTGQTKSTIVTAPHTLTKAEIESDGTIRIYRNSSNTYFAGISVSGTRATEKFTVTFNAGSNGTCGTASLTEASAGAGVTLPTVTPNSGYAFTGWYTAASEGTKVGDAGDTYNPTANITLYAQYLAQSAPGISIDNYNPSTPRGKAVTFTATATGAPTPTVTWYQSATAVTSGGTEKGTGTTYNPDVTTVGTYYYYAIASNGVSPDATSELITLTVTNPDVNRTGYNSYYVTKNETAVGGEQVLCDDITMVYDNVTYNKAVEDKMIESLNANYVASISSGTNGWGVTFTPTADGVLSVGVVINKNKTFSITNVTSFTYVGKRGVTAEYDVPETVNESNSWTTENDDDHKYWVIVTIDVKAANNYKFSVSGSKMSLYGFEFVPTGATETVSTLSGRNYGSYVPKATLDFGSAAGITAYIATGLNGAGDAVEMTAVDVVPAGTPIIVKTDTKGASVDVPVAAGATSNVSANKLVAGDGTTAWNDASFDGYDIYYLASDQFHKANAGTLQSGKAYLKVSTTGAPSLTLSFGSDNGTTAIESVEKAVKADGVYYNLSGQRVAQPTKGLYIVNGKKVLIK